MKMNSVINRVTATISKESYAFQQNILWSTKSSKTKCSKVTNCSTKSTLTTVTSRTSKLKCKIWYVDSPWNTITTSTRPKGNWLSLWHSSTIYAKTIHWRVSSTGPTRISLAGSVGIVRAGLWYCSRRITFMRTNVRMWASIWTFCFTTFWWTRWTRARGTWMRWLCWRTVVTTRCGIWRLSWTGGSYRLG